MIPNNSIILIGPTGVGKSTIARAIAARHEITLVDLDLEIEKLTGSPISWIFDIEGEEGFRNYETIALEKVLSVKDTYILATGAGVIKKEYNRNIVKNSNSCIIYLSAKPKSILSRLNFKNRPMLQNSKDPIKTLEKMYYDRTKLYESIADFKIKTDNSSLNSVCSKISYIIRNNSISKTKMK